MMNCLPGNPALSSLILALALGLGAGTSVPGRPGPKEESIAAQLRRDVEHLAGPSGRRSPAHPEALARAAAHIGQRFAAGGGNVQVDAYEADGAVYRNVIARFGPAAGRPIVIGAHYDAVETTPGADDNASGVAGLLALADLWRVAPPRVPVEMVAYCLEEAPFFGTEAMGSRRHAGMLKAAGREPRLVMVLEMIGYFSDAPGNLPSARLVRLVKRAMGAADTIPVEALAAPESLPGVGLSDHSSYWREGMPAVMITDTAFYRNPHYHSARDRPDTLDYLRMAGVVKAVEQVIRHIEGMRTPP